MASETDATDVLLIGGGVASVRCARTLRREGFDGRIVLVGDESLPPYNRPPLSKELLRDDLPDELVLAEPERWYDRRNVERLPGRHVTALDAVGRTAVLDDGRVIVFDRCLLATGAEPRRLPVPGGEHAMLLRTLPDARRLRRVAVAAGPAARPIVIGGGFIGVEVASSLAARGLRPLLVELADALWAGTLGLELSAWAAERLAGSGVEVIVGAGVTGVEDGAAWIDDERVEGAFVLAGIGVRPRDELARRAGIACDDGILTDASHATTAPGVWAAGDVARVDGLRVEHWHAAREGGERAALAMLGKPLPPPRAPWVFSEVAGHILDVVGLAAHGDAASLLGEPDRDRFAVAWARDGRLTQVATVGGIVGADAARAMVERGASVQELGAAIDL